MGINTQDFSDQGKREPLGSGTPSADALRAGVTALRDEIAAEDTALATEKQVSDTIIEAEGERIVLQGTLTEGELRNAQAHLQSILFNELRLGANAGVLTQTGLIGSILKDKEARAARERENAKNSGREQQLLALQAALQAAQAAYEAADNSVKEILAKHLSQDEQDYLDGIDDPEFRAQEEMRLMKLKLAQGKISQSDFDDFEDRWKDREDKRAKVREAQSDLKSIENKQDAVDLVAENGVENAIQGIRSTTASVEQKQLTKDAVSEENSRGELIANYDADTEEASLLASSGFSDPQLPTVNLLAGTSVASQAMPDSNFTAEPLKNTWDAVALPLEASERSQEVELAVSEAQSNNDMQALTPATAPV